jgi:hypothetical protein
MLLCRITKFAVSVKLLLSRANNKELCGAVTVVVDVVEKLVNKDDNLTHLNINRMKPARIKGCRGCDQANSCF